MQSNSTQVPAGLKLVEANSSNVKFSQIQWNESEPIGSGSFGEVYKGHVPEFRGRRSYRPEMDVAIKVLKYVPTTPEEQNCFVREMDISTNLRHPCLIRCILHIESEKYIIVTEFAKSDLSKVLESARKGTPLTWVNPDGKTVEWNDTKKTICAAGVAVGLHVIHSADVIHRDLKAENIMLDENMYPKIGDFGLSRTLPHNSRDVEAMLEMTMDKGTPIYMAPEMFDERFGGYNQKADVYAYGMFLYELAMSERPFMENGEPIPFILRQRVIEGERPTIPSYVDKMWAEIMEQCWDPEPARRPSMGEVVKLIRDNTDEFMLEGCDVNEFEDYLARVLNADPTCSAGQ